MVSRECPTNPWGASGRDPEAVHEWREQPNGPKQPYRICLDDDAPFAFAGLWEHWEGEGATRETVTILTTEASERVEPIHDRMPVMLAPDEEAAWLAGGDDLEELLDPYAAEDLRTYPISRAVNDPENDSAAVIEPVDVREQSGLDEFGEFGG